MKQWFFSEFEAQQGPVDEDVLVERFRSGSLPKETLVWAEGMTDWVPSTELETFANLGSPVESAVGGEASEVRSEDGSLSPYAPPSAASQVAVAEQVTSGPQVRPWIRFWARSVDIMIFGVSLGIVLGMLLPEALEISDTLFNVLILAVIALLESVSLALFGTTPGKAIFRISIRNADGSKLSFGEALVRSLKVYYRGLGLGIPLVSLVTQITACTRLSNNGITSWDRDANLTVGHQTIQAWRWFLILLIIFGFFALISYGYSVE
ncbi:RDD family protein [Haloferula rosea]|uniref:RDD family protein n=1 Tax=Haloferula rosea TaxID=490093 RepID=A0A934RBV5_9BACT|nr:RDD family protein [Haloferula rosea]MBK1827680.1 RDD family protein [Haloferula rosea]